MHDRINKGQQMTYYEPVMYCFTKFKKAPRKEHLTYTFYNKLVEIFKTIDLNPRELYHLIESLQMLLEYHGEVRTYQVRRQNS